MDYLTSGNLCLKEGAFLIAFGAFLTSLGWFLLGKYKYGDINCWLSKIRLFRKAFVRRIITIILLAGIFAFIIIGLKKVCEGGTLTTKGWNLLNVHSQRQNLIRSVAQEWVTNDGAMKEPPVTGPVYDKVTTLVYIYPTFKTSALGAFLTSGLWNCDEPNEGRFLTAVSDYENAITVANQFFAYTNTSLTRNISNEQRIAKAVEYQTQILQTEWYHYLKVKHEELRKLLTTEYRWAVMEQTGPNTKKALFESEKGQTQNQPSGLDKH